MTANDVQYDKLRRDQCNELIPRVFRVNLPIDEILFDDIETGDGSYAILFRSSGDVYALFVAPDGGQQTLLRRRSDGLRRQPGGGQPEGSLDRKSVV